MLWAAPKGVDPSVGLATTALRFEDAGERATALDIVRGVVPAHEVELRSILDQAGGADTQSELDAARAEFADYYTDEALASPTSYTSVGPAAAPAPRDAWAGSGRLVGDQLWKHGDSMVYGEYFNGAWVTVGTYKFEYSQYVGNGGLMSTSARVQFNFSSASPRIRANPDPVCREDKFIDENCDNQPGIGRNGTYARSNFSYDDYDTDNDSKMFLNLEQDWYAEGYTPGLYTWFSGTFTSYRWKCRFSGPKCLYTGSS